ncbi:MAG TPA: hypothetical protein VIG99_26185, partial [Myxococcaceae bacterium]
ADNAEKRGSQAAPDPWSVSSSAQLFSRPTVGEAFKLSIQGIENGESTLSASISGSAFKIYDPYTNGLQLSVAYTPTLQATDIGLKWNVSLQDTRTFMLQGIGREAYEKCLAGYGNRPLTPDEQAHCADESANAISKKRGEMPAFSVGAAYTKQGPNRVLKANVALEQPMKPISIVFNGDFQTNLDGAFTGGLGGMVAFRPWGDWPLELSAGVKGTYCGGVTCTLPGVTLEASPVMSVVIKDTVVSASLTIRSRGVDPVVALKTMERVGGIAISYSFGPH